MADDVVIRRLPTGVPGLDHHGQARSPLDERARAVRDPQPRHRTLTKHRKTSTAADNLEDVMNHNVGIWIDHRRAVIVSVAEGRVTSETVESDVEAHPRYSGQQDGGGEKKYEGRHGQHLDRYYDEVISRLGQPDGVLILGPGEAKLELKERLSRSRAPSERTIGIETADKLTDPQIAAKVKEHFKIER